MTTLARNLAPCKLERVFKAKVIFIGNPNTRDIVRTARRRTKGLGTQRRIHLLSRRKALYATGPALRFLRVDLGVEVADSERILRGQRRRKWAVSLSLVQSESLLFPNNIWSLLLL